MSFDFASVWEAIAEAVPEALAFIHGEESWTWRRFEREAASLAGTLHDLGVAKGSRVAVCMENRPEYMVAQFAAFKLRAAPINVNFRYTQSEVAFVCKNAEALVAIAQAEFADLFLPLIGVSGGPAALIIQGAVERAAPAPSIIWQDALAHIPHPQQPRADEDPYILYTGGTTGLPKGVVSNIGDVSRGMLTVVCESRALPVPETLADLQLLARKLNAEADAPVSLVGPPLIHGTGAWLGVCAPLAIGGTAVMLTGSSFDPDELVSTISRRGITDLTIVGDAFARPMLAALEAMPQPEAEVAMHSLRFIHSSGAMWSGEVKDGLLRYADLRLFDYLGATEGGMGRMVTDRSSPSRTANFELYPHVAVFDDDWEPVAPRSGGVGRVAISQFIPQEYFRAPEKSSETFRFIRGVRYSIPGDYVRLEEDGSTTLLGRGSGCINTGGEKVFPEEVEEVIKRVPGITDCVVVGMPDARFGEKVAAILSIDPELPLTLESMQDVLRVDLAGYKVPRRIEVVPAVRRLVNGKADYRWARQLLMSSDR